MPALRTRRCAIPGALAALLFAGVVLLAPKGAMAQLGYAQKPVPYGLGATIKNDPTQPIDLKPFSIPYISIVGIMIHWSDIEPAHGRYNWERLDEFFDAAQKSGKYVHLYVFCGFFSPTWAIQGTTHATFTVPYGPYVGDRLPLPAPFDQFYLANWFAFVKQLSQRYGDRPEFLMIAAAGPTSVSEEVTEPIGSMAEIELWISLGFTATKYLAAWNLTFTTFAEYFPNQYISLSQGNAVPINAEGAFDPSEIDRMQQQVAAAGLSILGDQLAFQISALRGNDHHDQARQQVISWIGRSVTGFLFSTTCVHNPAGMGAAGDPQGAMMLAIQNGMQQNENAQHVDYIEVYSEDAEAEQMQPVLRWAASLFQ
jgi:Beta-galactosidase